MPREKEKGPGHLNVPGTFNKGHSLTMATLSYLERIDELEHVDVIRLKGDIDKSMIPVIEARIQYNRKQGSKIEKNVLVDYANVGTVDTAAIAFNLVRLKEYEAKGFKIGFMNLTGELKTLIEMFKQTDHFRIYDSEEEAVEELNK